MKFNPIEVIGLVLGIGGAIWVWVEQKNHYAPEGLGVVELGILLLLVGPLFSALFKKR